MLRSQCHAVNTARQGAELLLCVQELHQIAQGLLSNLLRNLCSCQVSDTFASRAPTIEPSKPGSVAMELWLPERYAMLDPAVEPPAWRNPSPAQVSERTGGTDTALLLLPVNGIDIDDQHSIRHRLQWPTVRIPICGWMLNSNGHITHDMDRVLCS